MFNLWDDTTLLLSYCVESKAMTTDRTDAMPKLACASPFEGSAVDFCQRYVVNLSSLPPCYEDDDDLVKVSVVRRASAFVLKAPTRRHRVFKHEVVLRAYAQPRGPSTVAFNLLGLIDRKYSG